MTKAADQGYEPAKDALKRLLATDTPTASTTETTSTAPEDQYKVGDHYYYGGGVLSRTISKQYLGIERPPIRATRPRNSSWARSMGHGWGVDKDYDKARSWYQKAADQGNGDAKAALSQLERKTNPPRQLGPNSPEWTGHAPVKRFPDATGGASAQHRGGAEHRPRRSPSPGR